MTDRIDRSDRASAPDAATTAREVAPVAADVAAIARLSEPGDGVTRIAYGAADAAARRWFADRCRTLGLDCQVDRYGNCFGWAPGARERPAVLLGSHLDSVRDAGRYDGVLGVVVAFELARRALARDPGAPVAVVSFACEESTRFGTPTVGSRLLLGHLGADALDALRDLEGPTLREVLAAAGLDETADGGFAPERIGAFVEVHVDQGRALADSTAVGIVSAIAGLVRTRVTWRGEAAHSGAQQRAQRRDALLGAARFAVAADALWERAERAGHVAAVTVGWIESRPNVANSVAGRSDVVVDLRSPSPETLDALQQQLEQAAREAAAEGSLEVAFEPLGRIAPVAMDSAVVAQLRSAAERAAVEHRTMPSMAGHDAEVLAHHVPTAMLFVANPAGVSHNPAEAIDETSLAGALTLLDNALPALCAAPATADDHGRGPR